MKLLVVLATAAALLLQSGSLSAQQGLGGAAPAMPANILQCADVSAALLAVANQDTRLRDWANLGRYREANRSAKPVVVFMGDSITDFWQQERFGGFFPGKNYADRGISAQTTPQMLLRFRPDVVALKPRAVVILAGTNDIAGNTGPMTDEDIQGNLASMSELAKASGIRVVLASILPVSAYHVANPSVVPQTTRRPMARIKAINDWMKSYAAANQHVYLDYFSAMVDNTGMLKSELSADDLHPNAAGYKVMGPLAEAAIAQALK
jgi:lysophospholipase L1-like esterase